MSGEWNDYPVTGFTFLDAEHRELGTMLNRFIATVNQGSRADTVRFLEFLIEAVAARFGHEEQLMREIGYAQLVRHREAHELCLVEGHRYLRDLRNNGPSSQFRRWATERFPEWFRLHMVGDDVALGQELAAHARAQASQYGDPDLDLGLGGLGLQ